MTTEVAEQWDHEPEYDAEIAPLMAQIIEICNRKRIPVAASFVYRRTEEGDDFCSTLIDFDGRKFRQGREFFRALRRGPDFAAITIISPKATP